MPSWASRPVTLAMAPSVSVITLGFLLILTELIVVTVLPPPVVATWTNHEGPEARRASHTTLSEAVTEAAPSTHR